MSEHKWSDVKKWWKDLKSEREWSGLRKWWTDLLKSAISFAFVTFIAITVLAHFEDRRETNRAKEMALLTLRQTTVPDFMSAAVYYETAAYAAYTDLYQWNDKVPPKSMLDYEREHYPRLLSGVEMIKAAFPEHTEIRTALDDYMTAVNAVFGIFDRVRDKRLDGTADTPIKPEASRQEFDQAREIAAEKRRTLFPRIFKLVYRNTDG